MISVWMRVPVRPVHPFTLTRVVHTSSSRTQHARAAPRVHVLVQHGHLYVRTEEYYNELLYDYSCSI